MKSRAQTSDQPSFLMTSLAEQLDVRQPLYKLAGAIPWETFEQAFADSYSELGRPAKPVRLMVGLILLKQLEDLSDETLVARWVQNPYYQFFCGMREFQWERPCDPSDLVYFRKRIGEEGATLILALTAQMHGEKAEEADVVVDTTVQEKNITFPTDSKLYRKIIGRCWKVADAQGVRLRRRYRKEVKQSIMALRFRRSRGKQKAARKGLRKLKTIAGRLVRELERKLPEAEKQRQAENFALYYRVLGQQRGDRNKIYSLHEPQVYCISKGKEHKKYEFGAKASVAVTKTHGVIVAAASHPENIYDGHTLPEVLDFAEIVTNVRPARAIVDRGYRGRKEVDGTQIMIPGPPQKEQTRAQSAKMRKLFRRRAAIEPVIGHLKHDFRLMRNYLKGASGDTFNLFLACAAWNLRKWMREVLCRLLQTIIKYLRLSSSIHPAPSQV
jgi:IS5 family transposase